MDAIELLALEQKLIVAHIPGNVTGFGHDLVVIGCNAIFEMDIFSPFVVGRTFICSKPVGSWIDQDDYGMY